MENFIMAKRYDTFTAKKNGKKSERRSAFI